MNRVDIRSRSSNDLIRLAEKYGVDKWGDHWYAQHYHHHFSPYRDRKINLLEIGVGGYHNSLAGGQSLRMWQEYFPNAMIYGIDIYDKRIHEEGRIRVRQGSQDDEAFLKAVFEEAGSFEIIIDDGSHVNKHVIKSFSVLFPLLSHNGIYAVEDIQTAYWPPFGGSSDYLDSKHTSVGFFKGLIDSLNYEELLKPGYKPSYFDEHIIAMHFYHNLILIKKGANNEGSNLLKNNVAVGGWDSPRSASTAGSHEDEQNSRRTGGITRTVNAGIAHHQAGRLDRAEALYRKALVKDPDHADALHLLGVIAYQFGQIGPAIQLIERALPALTELPDAHLNHGNALQKAGRLAEAVESYRRAIALSPDYGMAHSNLARALNDQGLFDAGLESSRRAVELIPDFLGAHVNSAAALMGLARFSEAEAPLRRALDLMPDRGETHRDLGVVLAQLGRFDDAVSCHQQAIALKPNDATTHDALGHLLLSLGRFEEALSCFCHALAFRPEQAETHSNLGVALKELGRLDEAVAHYQRAVALRPDHAEIHNNLGNALKQLGRLDEAIAHYERALALRPEQAETHSNLGIALKELGRLDEAIAHYERALALKPNSPTALAAWFHQRQRICDWTGYRDNEARVRNAVRTPASPSEPFCLLALSSTPGEQLACARRVAAKIPTPAAVFPRLEPRPDERIRLGYLSADFRGHPVGYLIAGLIERHDRRRFEVLGYSYGPDDGSAIRSRLTGAFDRFVDISKMPHRQAAELIHADGVDILIDLTGYTAHGRPAILAYRPAPIQVNYLGYPGTMGADFIDYIIVDRFLVPMHLQPFYSEKLVQLPNCYQPSGAEREVANRTPSRVACRLPAEGFVFCCFNTGYKLTPVLFDIWMRLLKAVPGSVLWLIAANALVKDNLVREAVRRDVSAERLVFAAPAPRPEYLARLGLADLFLDTVPYNAGATASDALWAGLPVLTCSSETYVGRMAGALLTAAGLPELITPSMEAYAALALRLATEPGLLAGLRQRLARNRSTMPLFDVALFTRDLEKAYRRMWETWGAGRSPAAFSVSPSADSL